MKTYVFILPFALALGCGFATTPYDGDGELPPKASDIARLGDASAAYVDSGEEVDADEEIDASTGVISDSGHIEADSGHLEPDAADAEPAPDDATTPLPDASEPPVDSGHDAAPDAALETPRAECFGCQTDAGCGPDAACVHTSAAEGLCLPIAATSDCSTLCHGYMPRVLTPALGSPVCRPDDGSPTLAAACLNFLIAGHSCD